MEIDEPPNKKICEGGTKEMQLSLILVIVASCLIFPINISKLKCEEITYYYARLIPLAY